MKYLFVFLGWALSWQGYSQISDGANRIWYVSESTEIDFITDPPSVGHTSQLTTHGNQPAAMHDNAGQLLFYTDGITVWNRSHEVMLHGSSLTTVVGVNRMSTVIVPHPGDGNLYYIFIATLWQPYSVEGFHYAVVDMSGDGGKGEVVQKGINLLDQVAARISVVTDVEDQAYWVIVHGFGADYYVYKVTETGISAPVISTVGGSVGMNDFIGQFQVSPDGTKLASSIHDEVGLCDFDAKTGVLSNYRKIDQGYVGVEFSPNSEVLYTATHIDLAQFDVSSGVAEEISRSKRSFYITEEAHELQLAYNGRIYINQSSGHVTEYLLEIGNPNVLGSGCNLHAEGVFLGITPFRLPETIQSFYRETPSLPAVKNCLGDPSRLTIYSIGYADSVAWDFGDGTSATYSGVTGKSVLHTYAGMGVYPVKATKYIGEIARELTSVVEIGAPLVVAFGSDTTLCRGATLTLDGGLGITYRWSTGDTTRIVGITKSGTHHVTTDNGYCRRSDTIQVKYQDFPVADLGADIHTCYLDSVWLATESNSRYHYLWSTGDTHSEIMVTDPGIYTIAVSEGWCTTYDTLGVYEDDIIITETNISQETFSLDTIYVDYGDTLKLFAMGSPIESWEWYFSDGYSEVNDYPDFTRTFSVAGTYRGRVFASNSTGCITGLFFTVHAEEHVFVPNVITPDGDGKNDVFEIVYNGGYMPQLTIFNRWGKPVYFNKTYQNTWSGEEQEEGIYYYQLKVGKKLFSGSLTVLR